MTPFLDLGGSWTLSGARTSGCLPATVPGCVHTDLLAAGVIEDPYVRHHELAVQWIAESGWTYARTFTVPPGFLKHDRILLRCEGLDTLAEIRVNGRCVGKAENAFRLWEFDVRQALRTGTNRIEVHFRPVIPYAETLRKAHPPPHRGSGQSTIPSRAWVRKSACNFGWDWGPKLVTCGIWRPIRLLACNQARLVDLRIQQDHRSPNTVGLDIDVSAEAWAPARRVARVRVEREGRTVARRDLDVTDGTASTTLVLESPQLWWPNGLGAQPLYTVCAELLDDRGEVLDSLARRIGLRTLHLERHPDAWGESFQFVINGIPFFAKGANWIPADTFVTRLTRHDYARLLRDAAGVHMNMLRVWGGGIYEDDAFYDLCDELGLCIWQDFMFACSTYPTFVPEFLRNVEAEARDNLHRLRHHPCIALWCGNNEIEQGLVSDQWNDHQMSWEDYSRLFDDLLARVANEVDPGRDYWPCSPHSPHGDRRDFNNPACGDAHLWAVWHGRQPFEWYRSSHHRFCSEFGFQAFPEPKTVEAYTLPEDRNITSHVMEHHQRSDIGNAAILHYMLSWFRMPSTFESTLWLSQILQGLGIKYAVDHWRRNRPQTMGALYWQINDCWPVASWSSIDWFGRWKALHYFARRFFAPLAVTAVEDGDKGTADLFVASDLREGRRGTIRWVLTTAGGTAVGGGEKTVRIPPRASRRALRLHLKRALATQGPRDLLLWLDLLVEDKTVSSDLATFARPKHLELLRPRISFSARPGPCGDFVVILNARHAALWAWLDLVDGDARYSDNFFHLRPGSAKTVTVTPSRALAPEAFRRRLRVRSLYDTYSASEPPGKG